MLSLEMSLTSKIKSNPLLKKMAHWLLIPSGEHRPRLWVRLFINPFKHKRGRKSIIRSRTRLDVFPFSQFVLGDGSVIEDFGTINNGVGEVIIGHRTIIGLGNTIIGPVVIGDDVMLAQNIVLSGMNHGYQDVTIPPSRQKEIRKLITIGDAVWIGANSVITAGVTVGKHSVIGAGSVVTKDIPPFSVAIGNPAKVIKQYDELSGTWKKIDKSYK
ncbi:acyltransferase [Pedobacter heparinus]|uniref:Acetyltransferase (Isoleucine patch superfamily) n=1 Tax=Pedobacter heparinus (strain ATCC 13125 / DSM 2366 / CIP 104194 / JCM 7457 / NBRC 12017 / NCIMB 9290 / NRRL B-14731 / HIM 762-3) TaxID=485917 RepID=C6XW90_PEDHD|nr:acyltransferase [Pedobacter heparinus]ACU04169.1 Acetyltransferase (isoleucine patch superfamily) [Pedobacter heparinus DSM 2366]